MKKEQLNKIVTGFEFNIGWLINYANFIVALNEPEKLVKAKINQDEWMAIVTPVYMLFNDCIQLAKEQGVDLTNIEFEDLHESDTSDTNQVGG